MELEAVDLLKYFTVYKNAYKKSAELIDAFYNSPSEEGYILPPMEEWEDQEGLRRNPRIEYYRDHPELDRSIFGGEVFKDFKARYPEDKVKPDDTAYPLIVDLLEVFEAVNEDYKKRWNLDINVIQHAPLELRYYQGPQGLGPHSDFMGYRNLHPNYTHQLRDDHLEQEAPYNQTFTYNVYLNDDYGEGGALGIMRYVKQKDGTYTSEGAHEAMHKPMAGDIIMFPCSFPYEHWMTPIGEGVRRFMVNGNAVQDSPPAWQFD